MKNKKQAIILSVIASIALLALIIGTTYAYFQASGGTGTSANLRVTTYTTDVFNFEVGNDISIYADATSFASGKGNASGNAVTDITSLTYKTVTDGKGASISGYDITNKSGLITLSNNKEITASPTKTDEWNITVTLVNYDKDQSNNMGKSFNAKLMIQKEKIKETVADVCSNGQTLSSCIIAMDGKDDTLYHHTSSLANGAGDNSYRYAGASESVNNFVCFGSTTKPCSTDNLYRIIGVIDGKVKLIKYDYANSNLLGTDGDYNGSSEPQIYYYEGSSTPHTYYKGSLSSIDIYFWNYKNDTYSNYGNGSNKWSTSLLNEINLNTNFINNIGSIWANKIAMTTWKVGGNTSDNIGKSVPSVAYQNEIIAPAKNTTYDAKIGLMYASDYGFAASPSAWTKNLYNYDGTDANGTSIRTINWMYMGHVEWTLTVYSSNSYDVFYLDSRGDLTMNWASRIHGSRPVLYLKSSVLYDGGSGTKDSPITLVV